MAMAMQQHGRGSWRERQRDVSGLPLALEIVLEQRTHARDDTRLPLRLAPEQVRRVFADRRETARLEENDRRAARRALEEDVHVLLCQPPGTIQLTRRDQRPAA